MNQNHTIAGLEGEGLGEEVLHAGVAKLAPAVRSFGGLARGCRHGSHRPFGRGRAGDVIVDQSHRHGVSCVRSEVLPQQLAVVSATRCQGQQMVMGVRVGVHLQEVGPGDWCIVSLER
jgi:hypothetical protein